jgi:hypothetical protein
VLVLWAARRLGRPVKWVAERSEEFISSAQGRDNHTRARLALDVLPIAYNTANSNTAKSWRGTPTGFRGWEYR